MKTGVTGIGRLDRGHHGVACRRYTQPTHASFVATAATTSHRGVDLGTVGGRCCKARSSGTRTVRINQPRGNTATMTGFARCIVGCRDVATVAGGRQHNNAADAVKSGSIDTRAVTRAASRCNATVRKFTTRKSGHACGWHQPRWHTIDVTNVTGRRSGHVRRSQASYGFWINAFKRSGRDRYAVAYRTSHCCTAVAEQRVCEFRTVWHRCAGHAGARPHVAGLAPERTHGNVATRDCGNGAPVRAVACCVGRAVTLGAVCAGGWNVCVNLRHGWQNAEITMTTIASSTGCKRNVIGSQGLAAEINGAAMALQAVAAKRMVGIIDCSAAATTERPCMEAGINRPHSLD